MRVPVQMKTYNKQYGAVENVICPHCGMVTSFAKVKNKTTGSVLFIPVCSLTNIAYVRCTACGAAYEVNKQRFNNINNNIDLLNAVRDRHNEKMEKQQKLAEKYSVGFSDKNHTVAVILSFLLTSLGAPFFYIGKPLLGILCLLISILGGALQFFSLLFVVCYGGFILAFFILFGKVKDGKGKYILSKKQKQMFVERNQRK